MRATAVVTTDGIAEGDYVLVTEARATGADTVVRGAIPITLRSSSTAPGVSAAAAANAAAPKDTRNRVIPHAIVAHGPTSWHEKPATLVIRTERSGRHSGSTCRPASRLRRSTSRASRSSRSCWRPTRRAPRSSHPFSRIEQHADAAVVYWERTPMSARPAKRWRLRFARSSSWPDRTRWNGAVPTVAGARRAHGPAKTRPVRFPSNSNARLTAGRHSPARVKPRLTAPRTALRRRDGGCSASLRCPAPGCCRCT